jgi:ABC-type nitrate/sulfonate/bicarbonate transport system permease component
VTERASRLAPALILVAALLGAWELYARASGVSSFLLPAPSQVLLSLWEFRSEAVRHVLPTLVETAIGFSIAIVIAIGLAALLDRVAWLRRAVEPLLVGSQTIPIVVFAPLVVVWFGFGLWPKVLIVAFVTFFPITIALLGGFASTPAEATDLMRSFGASEGQTFRSVRWPSGLPAFFTGLRISGTYAVFAAVISEYVGATEGLGIWIQLSQRSFRTDLVFAAVLLTAVLSVASYGAVLAAERLVIPWWHAARASARGTRPSG